MSPKIPPTAGSETCGCPDFQVSRRSMLQIGAGLGLTSVVAQLIGESTLQASFAAGGSENTLVVLSLRGGVDGLGVVVPHGDPGYALNRPGTRVPTAELICRDAMFGLHPKLAPLQGLWESGRLAAVQAVGSPVLNRSHFSAIEQVESAAPGSGVRTGWINRMIGQPTDGATIFDAVQMGMGYPTAALTGPNRVLATPTVQDFQTVGADGAYVNQRYGSLVSAWDPQPGPLATAVRTQIDVSKTAGASMRSVADSTVQYPSGNAAPYAEPLKQAAKLIRANLGTDVIAIDAGNWDLHSNYGTPTTGGMQSNIDGLARALAAFFNDLGNKSENVTVVTISEFGRRVAENGSFGFDHGWANMMLVAGAGVRGGQYYGSWPGLGKSQVADGDLAVTTDYRDILGEIISRRFPERSLSTTFPGHTLRSVGVMR